MANSSRLLGIDVAYTIAIVGCVASAFYQAEWLEYAFVVQFSSLKIDQSLQGYIMINKIKLFLAPPSFPEDKITKELLTELKSYKN